MYKKSIIKGLKKLLMLLGVSLGFLAIEAGVAYFISVSYDTSLQDVMTMEGIVVGIVGMLASMKGSSSGASYGGMASNVGDMTSLGNLQTVRLEREGDSYRKNFFKNSIVEYGLFRMALMISGLLLIFCSLIFF